MTDNPINPSFPCKAILFAIHHNVKKKSVYEATRAAWIIPEKYQNFTVYNIAAGLVNSISKGAYKISQWSPCKDKKGRYEFDGEEIPEFKDCTWYKQIELVKGFYKRGNNPIVEFDGNGRFKIVRGSKDLEWHNCL